MADFITKEDFLKGIDDLKSAFAQLYRESSRNRPGGMDGKGGSSSYIHDDYLVQMMKSSQETAKKAYELFKKLENIPPEYGKSAARALNTVVKSFKDSPTNAGFINSKGEVSFETNGKFDPKKWAKFVSSANSSAFEMAKIEDQIKQTNTKIAENKAAINDLPKQVSNVTSQLDQFNRNSKDTNEAYQKFMEGLKNASNDDEGFGGVEQYRRYMERLNSDGPASAQHYMDGLNKARREEVKVLINKKEQYEEELAVGKDLNNQLEDLKKKEKALLEADNNLKEKITQLENDRYNALYKAPIDKFYLDQDRLFTEWRHNWSMHDYAKSGPQGRNLAWQTLTKDFQFGNNSLTSNISKGVGTAAEKLLPRMAASLGKAMGPVVAILVTIAGLIKRGIDSWMEMEEKTLEITKSMGMGAHDAHGYQQAMMLATRNYAIQYGLDKDSLLKIQSDVNEATGRNMILNEDQLIDAVAGKRFMGDQTYATMLKSFEMAGGSPNSAMKYSMMTMERAAKAGLNMQKASADFAKNMGMVNKYSFKSGVDGISKMTLLSQQLKFNLESMTGLFDKTSTIEGSIDVAASMQMLGGTYATQFGNPMRLLYNSLNNVEEMTQSVVDMVVSKARFNEKTGTVDINNLDRVMIKEAAKITNMSQEDLFSMASRQVYLKQVRKEMAAELTEAQRAQLGNMAQFTQEQGWIVSYLDANNELVTKQISEIRAEDMEAINKGRLYESVEDNVENIWLLLKEKYRDEAAAATSLKAKKAGIDVMYDMQLGGSNWNFGVNAGMNALSHGVNRISSHVNDAFFYKDGTVHPLAPDDNVYAFKGSGQVDPGAGRFYNSSTTSMRMAEQMTQTYIKGSSSVLASAVSNSMRAMNNTSNSSIRYRETDNIYSSVESSVAKAVTNTLKAGAFNADVNVNGTINLRFPDGSSVDMIKQLQKPEVVRMLSSIIAQQLARLDNKGATPALGTNALKGTSI